MPSRRRLLDIVAQARLVEETRKRDEVMEMLLAEFEALIQSLQCDLAAQGVFEDIVATLNNAFRRRKKHPP